VAEELKEQTELLNLQAEKIELLEEGLRQARKVTKLQSRRIKYLTEPSTN
jgi:hypothetical protein